MEELTSERTTAYMASFSDGNISDTESTGAVYEYHNVSRTIIITTFVYMFLYGNIGFVGYR